MKKISAFLALVCFFLNCVAPTRALAQALSAMDIMPEPGKAVALTSAFVPANLRGMVVDPKDPFKLDFIIYRGDQVLSADDKPAEYLKLVKYFLAALAVPDKDQWVNLSPYEQDRIMPDNYGLTAMGRDVLAQDYMLKQISSSLINPDTDLGKKFWDAVYAKAYQQFGSTNIPTDVFNKVWIMPSNAVIYEKDNTVVIMEHHLKVMLESDYVAVYQNNAVVGSDASMAPTQELTKQVFKDVILPALEKEVNEGKSFAPLRQVYNSMLLAAWYKRALKESILGKVYADRVKVRGIEQDPKTNQAIFERYVAAFKQGVFNMIKEDVDPKTQETYQRKYFSGGVLGVGEQYDYAQFLTRLSGPEVPSSALNSLLSNADRASVVFRSPERVASSSSDSAATTIKKESVAQVSSQGLKGGVDFAQSEFNLKIKVDGAGVPLPISQQSLEAVKIDGLVPVITNIQAASIAEALLGDKK